MSKRPNKRVRTNDGNAYETLIEFEEDDLLTVHAHETRLFTAGPSGGFAGINDEGVTVSATDDAWEKAMGWEVVENTDFALDPDGRMFDDAVHANVMDEPAATSVPKKKKKPRSEVSRRPQKVWKRHYRTAYLDELIRQAGRGDFRQITDCPDCTALKREEKGRAEYRCSSECLHPDLTCQECCVRRHKKLPFHRIEKWEEDRFIPVTLKSLGLKIQLNHTGMKCSNPKACHKAMVVLHTNGIHEVDIQFCDCDRAEPLNIQLLRRRLYPASQRVIKTCATFELLDHLHKLALCTKAATYDFYRALEKLTDNTGLNKPKSRYRALFRMNLQWRHLKLLEWGGRGHDPTGPEGTKMGGVALLCPSCPVPGVNLPVGWEQAPPSLSYLYRMFACMDANFRLKNQLVSSYSQEPGLGIGMAYMVPLKPYEEYVAQNTSDADISSCVGFQALIQANTRYSKGLRYTGVGGVFCGRSEMVLPNGIGNLHKGERYANMDYIFASGVAPFQSLLSILISYDICCQWFINLSKRMLLWPDSLRLDTRSQLHLTPAIPKLHEPMHHAENHQSFSLNFIRGVGQSDMEAPERVWGAHNPLGPSTKGQAPGPRHDVLDDHFNWWNYLKIVGIGLTLLRRYRSALADRNLQAEAHRGFSKGIKRRSMEGWEKLCQDYEQDGFPKTKRNPYANDGATATEAEARRALALLEAEKLSKQQGGTDVKVDESTFVLMGLELEESQRRTRRFAKDHLAQATARQEGSLLVQRNQLVTRISSWELLFPTHMPGLKEYQAQLKLEGSTRVEVAELPENRLLWLPSQIPSSNRAAVCSSNVAAIEQTMRTSQCYTALDALRNVLKIKTRLANFKLKQIRGQRDGTRSRAVIDRINVKAKGAAEKYRHARSCKLALDAGGDWEEELKPLLDADIRGYEDPEAPIRLKAGRKGTVEDEQLEAESMLVDQPVETDDFNVFPEPRDRRDGTGATRKMLSWIWTMRGVKTGGHEDDAILRIEWVKSRARVKRSEEEVLLLREEMRRVLASLEWKARKWQERIGLRVVDKALSEGLKAYGLTQRYYQQALSAKFSAMWTKPLKDFMPTVSNNWTRYDEEESEDDVSGSDEEDSEDEEDEDEGGSDDISEGEGEEERDIWDDEGNEEYDEGD